jgi:hypothetical protein
MFADKTTSGSDTSVLADRLDLGPHTGKHGSGERIDLGYVSDALVRVIKRPRAPRPRLVWTFTEYGPERDRYGSARIDTPDLNGNVVSTQHLADRIRQSHATMVTSNETWSSTSDQLPTLSRLMADGRLHIVRPLASVEPQDDALGVRLGVRLANPADVAATYRVEEFTFRVAGISFPMSAESPFEQLPPGAEAEWWRDTYHFASDSFPVTIEVDYRVGYGHLGLTDKPVMRRVLSGAYKVGNIPLFQPARDADLFVIELRPTADTPND